MDAALIPANIVIGDRSYRIKILPSDEELVRKTLKIINDKILEFRSLFAGKDMQDYVSMVLIWYATQPAAESNTDVVNQECIAALSRMNQQLDDCLV